MPPCPNFVSISIFSAANKRDRIHDSVGVGSVVAVVVELFVCAEVVVNALVELLAVVGGVWVDLVVVVDLVVLRVVVCVVTGLLV